ncbi:MAG: DUF5658 family protein [Clostridium sp.]|uniref:DUF5658 family protein n=1 Tax=Clostridium sp. TaxID=1506 RepID=UPI003F3A2039
MEFIKSNNYSKIKKKLVILYILIVIDILYTLILVQRGYFVEDTTIMIDIVSKPWLSFLLKLVFTLLLMVVLYKRIESANSKQLTWYNIFICSIIFMYIIVNISHLIWFALIVIFL